jgi:hypothetical protein
VLVAVEKVGPWPRAATIATAALLSALAVAILAAPHDIPALVVPNSPGAMQAMNAMR